MMSQAITVRIRARELPSAHERSEGQAAALLAEIRQPHMSRRLGETICRLGALIRVEPGVIGFVAATSRAHDLAAARCATAALGHAGTRGAQQTLVDLAEDKVANRAQRIAAIEALGTLESPLQDTADAVRLLIRDTDYHVSRAATLALGLVLQRHESGAGMTALIGVLQRAESVEDHRVALRALGNTGRLEVLERIVSFVSHRVPEVRVTALGALAGVQHGEVDAILAERVAGDPDRTVRLAALQAIALRDVDRHLVTLISALDSERTITLRMELVDLLGRLTHRVAARKCLRRIATSDPAARVRQLARRLVR